MIDIRKLKELVRLMVANELSELDLRDSEQQVTLRRPSGGGAPAATVIPAAAAPAPTSPVVVEAPPEPAAAGDNGLPTIESPMVGTFYTSANPDSPPYVRPGTVVNEDTVVCIIEAMKIFNEIKAGLAGTVQDLLVENGATVEFGQPLITVKPG